MLSRAAFNDTESPRRQRASARARMTMRGEPGPGLVLSAPGDGGSRPKLRPASARPRRSRRSRPSSPRARAGGSGADPGVRARAGASSPGPACEQRRGGGFCAGGVRSGAERLDFGDVGGERAREAASVGPRAPAIGPARASARAAAPAREARRDDIQTRRLSGAAPSSKRRVRGALARRSWSQARGAAGASAPLRLARRRARRRALRAAAHWPRRVASLAELRPPQHHAGGTDGAPRGGRWPPTATTASRRRSPSIGRLQRLSTSSDARRGTASISCGADVLENPGFSAD